MGRSSQRKGADWERTVARWLRENGIEARRSGVAGQTDGDLVTDLPFQFECKNQKDQTAAIREGLEQLGGQSGVVVVKRRGRSDPGDALVVMTLRGWLDAMT